MYVTLHDLIFREAYHEEHETQRRTSTLYVTFMHKYLQKFISPKKLRLDVIRRDFRMYVYTRLAGNLFEALILKAVVRAT